VIDARSEFEFAPWTDLGAETVKIELWAKTYRHPTCRAPLEGKGKQKEMLVTDPIREGPEWTVLEQWNVTLADLVPLKPEVCLAKLVYSLILIAPLARGPSVTPPVQYPFCIIFQLRRNILLANSFSFESSFTLTLSFSDCVQL
jgi:hypothetical protein